MLRYHLFERREEYLSTNVAVYYRILQLSRKRHSEILMCDKKDKKVDFDDVLADRLEWDSILKYNRSRIHRGVRVESPVNNTTEMSNEMLMKYLASQSVETMKKWSYFLIPYEDKNFELIEFDEISAY